MDRIGVNPFQVVLDYTGMSFSPNKADFESGMERVVGKLEETVLCIQPLVMDPVFYPFTRPVLYGKQEDLAFKEGPSLQVSSCSKQPPTNLKYIL